MEHLIRHTLVLCMTAALVACGPGNDDQNIVVAEDLNALSNMELALPPEPAANVVVEPEASQPAAPAPVATPNWPKSVPAKPKPAAPKSAEPTPSDPDCAPEHREAGHC